MALTLLPAVDVASGRVARLDSAASSNPLEVALSWQRAGAQWLHLVDLDAAYGRGSNLAQLSHVVATIQGLGGCVQLSGGVVDAASLAAALDTGAARVNLAAAALAERAWCEQALARHADRLAVSLDVRDGVLTPRGYRGAPLGSALAAVDWLARAGARCYVVTDVDRDGSLAGPNLDLLRQVCARLATARLATARRDTAGASAGRPAEVVASGGVATLADLRALSELEPLGVRAVIAGRALLSSAFTVADALRELGSPR